MKALSHWDHAVDFTGEEVAALVLGIDPATSGDAPLPTRPMLDRLREAFDWAVEWQIANETGEAPDLGALGVTEQILRSRSLKAIVADSRAGVVDDHRLMEILMEPNRWVFSVQRFDRDEVIRWLEENAVNSAYQFNPMSPRAPAGLAGLGDFDPSDLPEELDAAIIAWTEVKKGWGLPSETAKQKISSYLDERYFHLSQEARNRIATMANGDKRPGRRKNNN
jgi:hypothetical protein